MKLYNAIVIYDVCVVAESDAEALAAVRLHIREEGLIASEQKAIESREARNVRRVWQDQKPLVAADVSDADFELCKGKTTIEVQEMIYRKKGK